MAKIVSADRVPYAEGRRPHGERAPPAGFDDCGGAFDSRTAPRRASN
jgi:hypothetical protein